MALTPDQTLTPDDIELIKKFAVPSKVREDFIVRQPGRRLTLSEKGLAFYSKSSALWGYALETSFDSDYDLLLYHFEISKVVSKKSNAKLNRDLDEGMVALEMRPIYAMYLGRISAAECRDEVKKLLAEGPVSPEYRSLIQRLFGM